MLDDGHRVLTNEHAKLAFFVQLVHRLLKATSARVSQSAILHCLGGNVMSDGLAVRRVSNNHDVLGRDEWRKGAA